MVNGEKCVKTVTYRCARAVCLERFLVAMLALASWQKVVKL